MAVVVKNLAFTGTVYDEYTEAVNAYHASNGETIVILEGHLTATGDKASESYRAPTLNELNSTPAPTYVESVISRPNISVDNTDPANPVITL